MEQQTTNIKWSDENIIALIRNFRNDLIKDFLDERYLKDYLLTNYKINEVSNIRIELMKKGLKELLISPVDLNHYGGIISRIRETDIASLSTDEKLFLDEIVTVLKRNLY